MNRTQFIEKLAPFAVADMRRTNISASLTIAQGCLESSDGNSGLTQRANNLFGIKGKGPAGSVVMPTREQRSDGTWYMIDAAFRKYNIWGESVADHSALILNGVSWNRGKYLKVIGANGRTAAREIAAAGYATDKIYAEKLIMIMDQWNLYQYDAIEEVDELQLNDNEWQMLINALEQMPIDKKWAEKARKRELTLSELTWLNTIVLVRK